MKTMLRCSLGALLIACAGYVTAAVPTWINVTSIIHDEDTSNPPNQYLLRSGDYNSAFQATYTNTANKAGTGGVRSQINAGNGSWTVYLGNQSLRRIWLTLASQGAPVPDGMYYANTQLYSQCYNLNGQPTGWLAISPGTANNHCSLTVDFASGGTKYMLVMGPVVPGDGSPDTGWATVSCTGGNSAGACAAWTINPYIGVEAGNFPTVAALYRFTNSGGLVLVGQYHLTYRIDVSNP